VILSFILTWNRKKKNVKVRSTTKMNSQQTGVFPIFLVLCTLPPAMASEDLNLETWEIALIAGVGTLSLLMCCYSIYVIRRRSSKRKVDIETGIAKDAKTTAKDAKTTAKDAAKTTTAKDAAKTTTAKDAAKTAKDAAKTTTAKDVASSSKIAVQPNNFRSKTTVPVRNSGRRHSI
jgi:hypothetical protein